MSPPAGLALLDKPAGITSFKVLAELKRALGSGQVGHTGTLDPFATGLLAALTGAATRLAPLFDGLDKTYLAVFTFGLSTDTLDPGGAVVQRAEAPSREELERAADRFRGWIEQRPPEYSAVHVAGKRAYQLAREGRRPELPPRRVCIHRLELLSYDPPELRVEIHCSKGTYVRSLARDLGLEAGSCAYVSRLQRTRVGEFRLEEARPPADALSGLLPPSRFLRRLPGVRALRVDPGLELAVRQGGPFRDEWWLPETAADGLGAVFDGRDRLLAVVSREGGAHRYLAVFPEGAG